VGLLPGLGPTPEKINICPNSYVTRKVQRFHKRGHMNITNGISFLSILERFEIKRFERVAVLPQVFKRIRS
jgi:hypothetical protein